MYTGTLIEELIATVERAEEHVRGEKEAPEPERFYLLTHQGSQVEPSLLGVA